MPTLTLRVTAAELAEVRRRARVKGKNVSAYVRGSILPPKSPAARPRIIRDKATGSLTLKHPAGTPAITSELVRAILADFP